MIHYTPRINVSIIQINIIWRRSRQNNQLVDVGANSNRIVKMTTSGVALLILVLILTEPAASQVYKQATYGQGVYAQYPKPMIIPQAAQSDITVFIIPLLLVVLVAVIVPALVGSSWTVMKEMKTTKPPTTTMTTTTTTPPTTTPFRPGG